MRVARRTIRLTTDANGNASIVAGNAVGVNRYEEVIPNDNEDNKIIRPVLIIGWEFYGFNFRNPSDSDDNIVTDTVVTIKHVGFVPPRTDDDGNTVSPGDVEWYQTNLAKNYTKNLDTLWTKKQLNNNGVKDDFVPIMKQPTYLSDGGAPSTTNRHLMVLTTPEMIEVELEYEPDTPPGTPEANRYVDCTLWVRSDNTKLRPPEGFWC